MTVVPLPAAMTLPVEVTEATAVLLLDQLIVLLVALLGVPVTVSVSSSPTFIATSDLLSVRLVINTAGSTLTVQVALTEGLEDCAVMIASPYSLPAGTPTAVILPVSSTVATAVLLLDQVTAGSAAPEGVITAVSFFQLPL